ncbi:response regulator transcription factor [Chryseobacterium salipaludis]|uniref:LuxR C-terminal-related transcriptional regulator n=1 Tax=Chryseobacterium TaxID=59732 RepID=UPI001FF674BC|nr:MULTISPECIES: response regulator transcription factor [Chryseobacterium]MCJ8498909.1 response regulator transcription factor [Chryseobacterium salipaludis]MCX3297830.1 response regulator transcription factor [Planobacterium sp. JC490]
MQDNKLRVLVADDHGIVRIGMIQLIKEGWPQAVFTEAEDFQQLKEQIATAAFDLAVVDANMPNGTLQQAIDYRDLKQPDLKILVFSSQDENVYAMRYLEMGAQGFMNKLSSKSTVHRAIATMLQKGKYLSEEMKENVIFNSGSKRKPIENLSNRELEIASKLAEGQTITAIADIMNLHPSTVSTYKNRLFKKLNIDSLAELIAILDTYQ